MTTLPAGWMLVPIEPTDEMETAAEDDYEQTAATFPRWKSAYAAMLAAAPTPPASAQDDAKVYHFEQRSRFGPWIEVEKPTERSVEFVQRADAPAAGDALDLLQKLEAWQAVCDRIVDQYGGVVAGVDFGALGRANRTAIDSVQRRGDARLLEFVREVAQQKPEKPDYWSSCGQCARNISTAEELLEAHAAIAQQSQRKEA